MHRATEEQVNQRAACFVVAISKRITRRSSTAILNLNFLMSSQRKLTEATDVERMFSFLNKAEQSLLIANLKKPQLCD